MRKLNPERISFRFFKIVIINLLLLLLLLEVVAVGFYYFQTGTFFYSRKRHDRTIAPPQTSDTDGIGADSIFHRLHPYFGFVYGKQATKKLQFSQVSYSANNFGILSPHNYPLKKTNTDQFIIGIFGGSVSMRFGFYELENHVLVNALKRLPYFQNKQIIVLPFASGAYKQPQQLIALNYFISIGQEFDMVINIDGFNEAALSYLNNKSGADISMPNSEIIGPMIALADKSLSLDELSLTLEILKNRDELKTAENALDKRSLATMYMLNWLQHQYLRNQYQKKLQTFNTLREKHRETDSLVYLPKNAQPLDDAETLRQMSDLWANSSLAMEQLLGQKKILYFHVIQPNQYFRTGRQFSEAERKVAFGSNYEEGVRKGYPVLLSKVGNLEKAGVRIINAVSSLDEVKDPVYEDNCCHYNKIGNEVFASYVARNIVAFLNEAPPK